MSRVIRPSGASASFWPALAVFVLVTAAGELVAAAGLVPLFLLPPPSQVLAALARDHAEFGRAFAETAVAATAGLAGGFVAGGLIAAALSAVPILRRAVYPYTVFFQTVPVVAVAPLLVVWFGFGLPTVIASAFLVAIFPIIANTMAGLASTDPGLADLFRVYSADRRQTLLWLRIPAALPHMFAGLRVGAGLAVIGAVVGEFIAGGGLGGVVDVARTQQRVDKVFAAVLLSTLLGLVLIGIINALARKALGRWHSSRGLS